MHYPDIAITDDLVPAAVAPAFRHVVDTYASETNKVVSLGSPEPPAAAALPAPLIVASAIGRLCADPTTSAAAAVRR